MESGTIASNRKPPSRRKRRRVFDPKPSRRASGRESDASSNDRGLRPPSSDPAEIWARCGANASASESPTAASRADRTSPSIARSWRPRGLRRRSGCGTPRRVGRCVRVPRWPPQRDARISNPYWIPRSLRIAGFSSSVASSEWQVSQACVMVRPSEFAWAPSWQRKQPPSISSPL